MQSATQHLDDKLHDAEVIENGNQGREEDDDWQNAEGKYKATTTKYFKHLIADQATKQEINTILAIANDAGNGTGDADQNIAANRNIQNECPRPA